MRLPNKPSNRFLNPESNHANNYFFDFFFSQDLKNQLVMKNALIFFLVGVTAGCSSYPTKINDNTNLLGAQIGLQTSVQDLISKFGEPENQLITENETLFTFCERKGDIVDILYVLGKNNQVIDTKRAYYSIGIFDSANVPCSELLMPREVVNGKIGALIGRGVIAPKKRRAQTASGVEPFLETLFNDPWYQQWVRERTWGK